MYREEKTRNMVNYFARKYSDNVEEEELAFFLFAVDALFIYQGLWPTNLKYVEHPEHSGLLISEYYIELMSDQEIIKVDRSKVYSCIRFDLPKGSLSHIEACLSWNDFACMGFVINKMLKGANFKTIKTWKGKDYAQIDLSTLGKELLCDLDLFEIMNV